MRKVKILLTVSVDMVVDEGTEVQEIVSELDYDFVDTTGKADINDTEIVNHEVIDSR